MIFEIRSDDNDSCPELKDNSTFVEIKGMKGQNYGIETVQLLANALPQS